MEIENDILESLLANIEEQEKKDKHYDNKYELVTRVAFLTGVLDHNFEPDKDYFLREVYEKLKKNERAMIIRNLCILRNSIEHNYKKINDAIKKDNRSFFALSEFYPEEAYSYLESKGIRIPNVKQTNEILCAINRHISDRINNCKDIMPEWINWDYIKELFIMPNGQARDGIMAAANLFYSNMDYYPFGVYINWEPKDLGNIFAHDFKFATLLYSWHKDKFYDISNVSDVSESIKERIYEFINDSDDAVFVVDCENSDPYSLCAAFNSLDNGQCEKIKKIILYDDPQASTGWKFFEQHINFPGKMIEHILIQRVLEYKSLLDVKLTARIMKEHYSNNINSFILVSSDSDFWGLMEELKDVNFLVMLEHRKASDALKKVLDDNNIFYCYTDDFYTGLDDSLKKEAMFAEFANIFNKYSFNINDAFEEVIEKTRVELQDGEKKRFYEQYLKNIQLVIDKEGNIKPEIRRK